MSDFTDLPVTHDDWQAVLDWAADGGIKMESDWIEFKESDPSSAKGSVKTAAFIIGAANRPVGASADRFNGHAALILGVDDTGRSKGVPIVDLVEIEKRVDRYLDPELQGRWRAQTVPLDNGNQVFIVIVRPPKVGDPAWNATGAGEGIDDGAFYIRAGGSTRRTNSAENRMLAERAGSTSTRQPEIEVSIASPVFAIRPLNIGRVEEYIESVRSELLDTLPKAAARQTRTVLEPPKVSVEILGEGTPGIQKKLIGIQTAAQQLQASAEMQRLARTAATASAITAAQLGIDRSRQERYREEVDGYCEELRSWFDTALQGGYAAHKIVVPLRVAVTNTTDIPAKRMQVTLTINGPIQTIKRVGRPELPTKTAPWGHRPSLISPAMSRAMRGTVLDAISDAPVALAGSPSADVYGANPVTVVVDDINLRSKELVGVEAELGILLTDPSITELECTWEARADSMSTLLAGQFTVKISPEMDVTAGLIGEVRGS